MSGTGEREDTSGGEVSEKTCLMMKNELSFVPFLEEEDLAGMPCYFEPREIRAGEVLCREGPRLVAPDNDLHTEHGVHVALAVRNACLA